MEQFPSPAGPLAGALVPGSSVKTSSGGRPRVGTAMSTTDES